ncbi:restriction endonuclease subunit S [Streptomyces griseoluteus]|uniref:restriction endonuclease subunit S n=1 Tax=Streptomyces griseoluteus TaxID=29306 RepID=UPI00340ABE56
MSEGDIPSELPEGWVRVRLDEVAEVRLGRQRSPKNHSGTHMRPYLRAANVDWSGLKLDDVKEMNFTDDEVAIYGLKRGDIVLSEASGSASEVGKPAIWNDEIPECCLQNTLIRVRSYGVDPHYLLHFLRGEAIRGAFVEHSRGVGIHHIGSARLAAWSVPVPPLEEQRRIVAVLDEQLSRVDAAVRAVQQGQTRSAQLWASILHQMTEGALSPGVQRPVAWKRADQVAVVQGGIQKQARRRPVNNKFPFLRVANVPRGHLALDEVHEVELFDGELDRYRLKVGDLLVVEGNGSPDQVGRAATWNGEIENCVHQNHLIRVRPGKEIRAEFLELAWNSPKVAQQLKRVASSTSGLYTLSTAKVKSVEIPVPSLDEQDALLEAVRQWRTKQLLADAAQHSALVRAAALRGSLLVEAFAGRLVLQDPTDRSADALLDDIRAEREAASDAKPRRRRSRRAPTQRKHMSDTTRILDAPPPPHANAPALATATQPTLDLEIPS